MMNPDSLERCVVTGMANDRTTWCGRTPEIFEWTFEDASHAALYGRQSGHLRVCRQCRARIVLCLRTVVSREAELTEDERLARMVQEVLEKRGPGATKMWVGAEYNTLVAVGRTLYAAGRAEATIVQIRDVTASRTNNDGFAIGGDRTVLENVKVSGGGAVGVRLEHQRDPNAVSLGRFLRRLFGRRAP